jgi:glutamate-1-semialdehyde aminotransferase
MVRFVKNGSDATEAAIRIARAYTGRERVAYCGYHGFHDWFAGTTPRPAGVPEAWTSLLRPFEYNRIETLAALFDEHPGEYAAVILEQGGVEPSDEFLARVRDWRTTAARSSVGRDRHRAALSRGGCRSATV